MIRNLHQHTPVLRCSLNKPNLTRQEQPQETAADSVSLSKPGIVRKAGAFLAASLAGEVTAALCFVGGALYSATVLGPVIVGASKADVGPHSVEEAVFQAQTGLGASALMAGPSMLGSIGKEFAAPVVWGFEGGKEAFTSVYGYLTH